MKRKALIILIGKSDIGVDGITLKYALWVLPSQYKREFDYRVIKRLNQIR